MGSWSTTSSPTGMPALVRMRNSVCVFLPRNLEPPLDQEVEVTHLAGANVEVTPSVDANTKILVVAFSIAVWLYESADEHAHCTDVWSQSAILQWCQACASRERRFAGVGGFGLGFEYGHWTKPLRACADQLRTAGFRRLLFGSGARHQRF